MKTTVIIIGLLTLTFYFFWKGTEAQENAVISACDEKGHFVSTQGATYSCAKEPNNA